ncbi:hypothetical protein TRVL_00955 [Trypanosoma vivax]|nr:hypothetical protein TRVL_00955 [Trypanosoma vivax]
MRGITALYCISCEREGCVSNSQFLQFCTALDTSDDCPTHLDLRGNYLGDVGAAAVVRTVAIMAWVRAVDLRDCGAGAKTVSALVDIAGEHPHLRCVDLRGSNSSVFAVSGRSLLRLLKRSTALIVHVNYEDLQPTLAESLKARNRENGKRQKEEENAEDAAKKANVPVFSALSNDECLKDLLYLATRDALGNPLYGDGTPMQSLVDGFNTYMEDYLEAYSYIGRVAALLAVDLGPSILPCIRSTAVAMPPYVAANTGRAYPVNVDRTVRAVDALLSGIRANPFLLQELEQARGSMIGMYYKKLYQLRGDYEAFVSSRIGSFPLELERQTGDKMLPLYNRIVAGIVEGSMNDLPSMSHVEERLRQLRIVVLDSMLDGRERALTVPLLQLRYFSYNRAAEARAWSEMYMDEARAHFKRREEKQTRKVCIALGNAVPVMEAGGCGGSSELGGGKVTESGSGSSLGNHSSQQDANDAAKALRELRELLAQPYTAARYSVTRPLAELLPLEMRFFLCDLALRRAAFLYTPRIFVCKETLVSGDRTEEHEGKRECTAPMLSVDLDDPFDIVSIFRRVQSRGQFSEVMSAFEEWYRLHQVERYDVTYVSRQELLSAMSQM